MLRTIAGWALTVLGLLCALLGLSMAVVLGPDGRRTTGPHTVDVDSSVLVTAPRVITWGDVKVDVLVEVPAKKPVFIGLGNTVDVENLVANVQRTEVTKFETPWKPTLKAHDGEQPTVRGAPTALDWWIADSAGLGGASISTTLPDEPTSIAVVAIGASSLSGLKVTLAYGIAGGFFKGLGLAFVGAGLFLGGRILRRGESPLEEGDLRGNDEDDEEVVYVYVDDDGVEHVLTEDEIDDAQFEVIVEDEDEPEPEPEPRYVWIDDDGVEHEMTQAELDELGDDVEIVDDEQEGDRS